MRHFRNSLAVLLTVLLALALSSDVSAQGRSKLPDSLSSAVLSSEEGTLQDLLDGLGYNIDVANDETGIDDFCAPDGFNTATMILEVAGSASSAHSGFYEAGSGSNRYELFGPSDGPGSSVTFTVPTGIDPIGFYMEPHLENPTKVWYTETSLNSDSYDHVWVFPAIPGQPNEFVVAFEDLPDGGDQDHQDLVIKVIFDYVDPVLNGCPSNLTLNCEDPIPPPANVTATADCDDNPTLTFQETETPGACPQEKTITRTWTVTDKWGGSAFCTQTITIVDNTPPQVTCPGPLPVQCAGDVPTPNTSLVTAIDNCDPAPVVAFVSDVSDGQTCPETITRTYSATDACSNSATCTQIITVDDTQPPVLTGCPSPAITVECDAVPTEATVTALDNCDGVVAVVFDEDITPGACDDEYTITRTWTATDACNNQAQCQQVITVEDTTPPDVTCPGAVAVQCAGDVPAPNTSLVSAIDNCDPAPVVAFVSDVSDGQTCPETITRTYKAMDRCDNVGYCTQTITVDDQTAPVLTGCPSPAITVECDAVPTEATVTALDNCDGVVAVVFNENTTPGACADEYTITRTWTATDACDNQAQCQQVITVEDDTPPVVTCPGAVAVECMADVPTPNPAPKCAATATDNCDPDPLVEWVSDDPVGTCPTVITRTYKATDRCGNIGYCTQIITVDDQTPPVLSGCPSPSITVECDAVPDPANVTALDNCDGVVAVVFDEDIAPGACEDEYTITRTWTATDACGNPAQCQQVITVEDTEAPVVTCPDAVPVECPGDVPAPNTSLVTATDNCDPDPLVEWVSDNPSGTSCPLTITRTYKATDRCDNVDYCTQTITVNDQTPPVLTGCPSPAITVECDAVPTEATVTALDNCDGVVAVVFNENTTPGACDDEYTITRTWTATDACGNPAQCQQVLTVEDTTPPDVTCPDALAVECISDVPVPDIGLVSAADNCDPSPVVEFVSDASDGQTCPETITRTYKATDRCDNIGYCTQTITVDDQTPPICNVPDDITEAFCVAEQICRDVSVSDNCDPDPTMTVMDGPGEIIDGQWCYTPTGSAEFDVTARCEDACENFCEAVFHVDLTVNVAPSFTNCPTEDQTVHWGHKFEYDFTADDPDAGETLTFSLCEGAPEGATIDATTGHFEWQSEAADVCDPAICVIVTDHCQTTDECEFYLCVTNDPPIISCPEDITTCHGYPLETEVMAEDPDNSPYMFFYLVSGPAGVEVDADDGTVTWPEPEPGSWEICVTVTDSSAVCDPCSPHNADSCCFTVNVVALDLVIEKIHEQVQGQYADVSISFLQEDSNWPIAGYDFLIQYDASALSFLSAGEGQFFLDCRWEYFTYRFGPSGNCGPGACPSGVLRVVAMAESTGGNVADHPDCYSNDETLDPGPGSTIATELAVLTFLVSNDRTLECQFVPIRFVWYDCGDNGLSNVAGDTLYISNLVFDYAGEIGDPPVVQWNPALPPDTSFPTLTGAPSPKCDISDKFELVRCANFYNGGIDIVCADLIDDPGDVNMNGIGYEIADAVMLTNYFIEGLTAFADCTGLLPGLDPPELEPCLEHQQGAIAASDTNRDGITLSVADLVYIIRVVIGDALPYEKVTPGATIHSSYSFEEGVVSVADDVEIGGAALVVRGVVTPRLLVDGMDLSYACDGACTRIVVRPALDATTSNSFTGSFLAEITGELISIELASAEGVPITAKNVPTHYRLTQNYPNPFNPTTKIEFALPQASSYRLTIFNIQGQVVDIHQGRADAPGVFTYEWDGSERASGVYLYRLEAGSFTQTKKMLMLK